jgi:hypothetical protein
MSSGEEVFLALQRLARSHAARTGTRAPTAEYVTRHGLESFVDRLCGPSTVRTSSSKAASC